MMNKVKFIFPVLALGLILSSTAFANTSTTPTTSKNAVITKNVCTANAKATYTTAVKVATKGAEDADLTAKVTMTTALKEAGVSIKTGNTTAKVAKTAYLVALKNTKTLTDKTARVQAIKTANDTYKAALKDARASTTAGSTSVKVANATYKTAVIADAKTKVASVKTALSDYTKALKACPKK